MNAITNCDLISLTKLTPSNCTQKQSVKNLQSVLKNHLSTLKLTLEAIRLFQQGLMPDSLVGENACQIRAAIYTHLARDKEAMQRLAEVVAKVEDVIARLSPLKIVRECSLVELLEENGADLKVHSMICPIVFGHILMISKESDLSIKKEGVLPKVCLVEGNDPKKVGHVSVSLAKIMIQKARQALSELSVQYLRDEAAFLGIEGPKDVIIDKIGLHTTPLLEGMKILLASMKVRGTPIVLKNRIIDAEGKEKGVVALLCKAGEQGFQVVEPRAGDLDSPAMIIKAVSISEKSRTLDELKAEMVAVGIEPIILANCAAHPQYGGVSKGIEPPQTEEREILKALALEKGLCEMNPDLCQIYHIFPDLVGRHLEGDLL